ncbi:MAG: enoyl-CoA hydratase-related protein, partial [Gammaproteobacteria bacterium]|nr:enoyl-CoA hydratase-related protein [Gammaproteobacteria bacterium]
ALQLGLVTEVASPEDLEATAFAKASEIANNPTAVVMMIKELLLRNPMDPDLEAVMERENLRDQIARRQADHKEAISAFLAKREPNFNQN